MARFWSALFLGVLVTGCSNSTPVTPPATNSAPKQTAATESKPEPLPEDAPELKLEEGFELLGFDAFEKFFAKDPKDAVVWQAAGNGFDCFGKPRGYLYSKQSYDNFTLKFDYRFRRPADLKNDAEYKGNTGLLVYINEPHKQWPVSLEVQGKYTEMASVKANGGAKDAVIQDDDAARQTARKPVGEWNRIEVTSKDGVLTTSINGTKICTNEAGELKSGLIGFQAEDFEVQFRNLRVRKDQ